MTAPEIRVEYETLQEMEHLFSDQAEKMKQVFTTLKRTAEMLRRDWMGESADKFFQEFERDILPTVARAIDALHESGASIGQISSIFARAEEEAGNLFKNGGDGRFSGGGGGGGGGGAIGEESEPLRLEKFPTHLLQGTRFDIFARVAAGTMTFQQAEKLAREMEENPLDPKWHDYIEGKVTFFEASTGTERSLLNGTISSQVGNIRGDLFGYDAKAQSWAGIDKNGIGASGELSGEIYVGRLRETLNVGDLHVTTDSTVLSADARLKGEVSVGTHGISGELSGGVDASLYNARVDAKLGGVDAVLQSQAGVMIDGKVKGSFNPLNGDAGVDAEGNLFVGVRNRVQATYTIGFLKVGAQGEVDAGEGVGGKAKVGFENGVFHFDVGAYASEGVGGGGGVIVEVDAREAGKEIMGAIDAGYHFLFGN